MSNDLYARLEQYLQQNALPLAEAQARTIRGKMPDSELGPVAEARVLLAKNKPAEAEALLLACKPAERNLPNALAWLARAHLLLGKGDLARDAAVKSVQTGEEVPEALLVLGQLCVQNNQAADAVTWLMRVVANRPQDVGAWKALADAHMSLKQPGAAAQALQHAISLKPTDPMLWAGLIKACVDNGEVERAHLEANEALKRHPRDPEVLKAANRVRQAQTTTTDPLAAEMTVIRNIMRAGRLEEAYRRFTTINVLPRPSRAMKFLELELRSNVPGADATALYVQAQKLAKDYPHAWEPRAMMADLLMRKSGIANPRQAATHAEEAWTMSGGHPAAGLWLIKAWRMTGRAALVNAVAAQLKALGPDVAVQVEAALK
jgi:tetratricopeptide (TPR) repeat protein